MRSAQTLSGWRKTSSLSGIEAIWFAVSVAMGLAAGTGVTACIATSTLVC
jgi:hypothetical protein